MADYFWDLIRSKGRADYQPITEPVSSHEEAMSCERSPLLPPSPSSHGGRTGEPGRFHLVASAVIIAIVLLLLANEHAHIIPVPEDPLPIQHETQSIRPGSIFLDTRGQSINAHGGGFLLYNDTYYWYGEIKTGPTYLPASNADWGGTRVDLTGISCYASEDLMNWEYRGNVLPAVEDVAHDLYRDNVAERPKVVFNAKTGKFVMWLHIDGRDYGRARCGVAVSDAPGGPFEYLRSFRPNGQMARDLTVFVDDDSRAYLFTSSEDNAAIHIAELRDDYLATEGNYTRAFVGRYMEAPAVFKRNERYYFIGSGCTAWKPNAARSAIASSIWGPWRELGNPCRGEDANTTFHSQSTYILHQKDGIEGDADRYIFMADRWNENNLSDSRYIWLPLSFGEKSSHPTIAWQGEWSPSIL